MKHILLSLLCLVFANANQQVYATFDVAPLKQTTLALDVSGIVHKVYVDVGSPIKAGEVLLELENSVQKNDLELARKDLKVSDVQYARAQANYERYMKVKNVIDEFKLDSFRFDMLVAEAAYERAKSYVDAKQTLYEKTILKAPFDGVISAKKIEVGDGVSGMTLTPLFEIISSNGRKLLLSIDEKYSKVIRIGQTFTYKTDGESKTYIGKITKVYPTVDPKTRTLKAEVYAQNLKPGIFGDGYIEVK